MVSSLTEDGNSISFWGHHEDHLRIPEDQVKYLTPTDHFKNIY